MERQVIKRSLLILLPIIGIVCATAVFAAEDIAGMAKTVQEQAGAIAKLMNIAAYVAGVGFALAGVLQFKAHKENPQQTPLSKPVVMIVVAACLLFLPSVMDIAGKSLFGESGKKASAFTSESGGG